MVRIFKIFSVAALLLSVVLSANGEVALGNRVYLHLEYSRGGDRRFLSGLVKKLHKIAGKSKVKRPYKKITFHTSRHTFATLLYTNGADIYTISKLLGHKSISSTQIYASVIDKKKIEAVALLDKEI